MMFTINSAILLGGIRNNGMIYNCMFNKEIFQRQEFGPIISSYTLNSLVKLSLDKCAKLFNIITNVTFINQHINS